MLVGCRLDYGHDSSSMKIEESRKSNRNSVYSATNSASTNIIWIMRIMPHLAAGFRLQRTKLSRHQVRLRDFMPRQTPF